MLSESDQSEPGTRTSDQTRKNGDLRIKSALKIGPSKFKFNGREADKVYKMEFMLTRPQPSIARNFSGFNEAYSRRNEDPNAAFVFFDRRGFAKLHKALNEQAKMPYDEAKRFNDIIRRTLEIPILNHIYFGFEDEICITRPMFRWPCDEERRQREIMQLEKLASRNPQDPPDSDFGIILCAKGDKLMADAITMYTDLVSCRSVTGTNRGQFRKEKWALDNMIRDSLLLIHEDKVLRTIARVHRFLDGLSQLIHTIQEREMNFISAKDKLGWNLVTIQTRHWIEDIKNRPEVVALARVANFEALRGVIRLERGDPALIPLDLLSFHDLYQIDPDNIQIIPTDTFRTPGDHPGAEFATGCCVGTQRKTSVLTRNILDAKIMFNA